MIINKQTKHFSGFTLVELLIGLSLGLLVVALIGTMFISSKVSFATSIQVARTQESMRFASMFLTRDLREASYSGCGSKSTIANHLLTTSNYHFVDSGDSGIIGWDYANTQFGDVVSLPYADISSDSSAAEVQVARDANRANRLSYSNYIAGSKIPGRIEDLYPIKGSDVIFIASEKNTSTLLADGFSSITSPDLDVEQLDPDITFGTVLKVGDCRVRDKFQNSSTALDAISTSLGPVGTYAPGNNVTWSSELGNQWSKVWGSDATVTIEEITVYYIGTGASGQPSLFRYRSSCGLTPITAGCPNSGNEELVEGIENMQIYYGEDTDGDNVANIYRSASDLNDFDDVVSIRVGLLIRSTTKSDLKSPSEFTLLDGVRVNPPDIKVLRYVHNMTIHLRNKGV